MGGELATMQFSWNYVGLCHFSAIEHCHFLSLRPNTGDKVFKQMSIVILLKKISLETIHIRKLLIQINSNFSYLQNITSMFLPLITQLLWFVGTVEIPLTGMTHHLGGYRYPN